MAKIDKLNELARQKELNKLHSGNHMLHSMYGSEGNSQFTLNQLSRIKIIEVYDSIATALIYKPRNPHSNMEVGDYILY